MFILLMSDYITIAFKISNISPELNFSHITILYCLNPKIESVRLYPSE